MRVDAARHHIKAPGIDDLGASRRFELFAHGRNALAIDEHIGTPRVIVINHCATADESGHERSPLIDILSCPKRAGRHEAPGGGWRSFKIEFCQTTRLPRLRSLPLGRERVCYIFFISSVTTD